MIKDRTIEKTVSGSIAAITCLAFVTAGALNGFALDIDVDHWASGEVDHGASVTPGASADVTVAFGAAGFPSSDEGQAIPLTEHDKPFNGDYVTANVQGIGFNISGSTPLASGSRVLIRSSNGNIWANYNLVLGANLIGLDLTDGWVWVRRTEESPVFVSDLVDVESLSLVLVRNDLVEHSYDVALFSVTSDEVVGGSDLQMALMRRFGVSSRGSVSDTTDSDNDGLNDLNEILAELDPDYMRDNMVVEIVSVDETGAEIHWVHVKDKTYTILRYDEIGGESNVVATVTAPETGKYEWPYKDISASFKECGFYLIRQE